MSSAGLLFFAVTIVLSLPGSLCLGEVNMDTKVRLPQRLIGGQELLRMVHDQTGAAYAYPTGVLVRQIDATPFNGEARVKDVVARLAPKMGEKDGVVLLDAALPDAELKKLTNQLDSDKPDDRRVAAYLLGNTKSARAVAGQDPHRSR